MARRARRVPRNLGRSLIVGAAAGAAGAGAMTLLQRLLERAGADAHRSHPQHALARGRPDSTAERQAAGIDDATVEGVERLAGAAGLTLGPAAKEAAGPLAHYLFGAAVGAAYGLGTELAPRLAAGGGVPFGLAVWLLAEEVGIPAAGLAPPPHRTPAVVHVRGALAHVAYGATLELLRRLLSPRGAAQARRAAR